MFLIDTQQLGEQTLNKIAEMALRTQLDEAEELTVRVKTDPGMLAQGKLATLAIAGEGLVMQQDLRMQVLQIQLDNIAVNPWKALAGNVELTEPSQGSARVVLTDADVTRAFNSPTLRGQLRSLRVRVEGEPVTLSVEQVSCAFRDERVAIDARIRLHGETQRVQFSARPEVQESGRGVVLSDVDYAEGKELSPELTAALLDKARGILNLSNFEMEGISLQIRSLSVEQGKLTLDAIARVTQFPQV